MTKQPKPRSLVNFSDTEHFYTVVPAARRSAEGDYGVMALDDVRAFQCKHGRPAHAVRVSHVYATGHWYAWCAWHGTIVLLGRTEAPDLVKVQKPRPQRPRPTHNRRVRDGRT